MADIQTTYAQTLRRGVPGHITDMTQADLISRTVETAGGAAFGSALFQGTNSRGVVTTVTDGKFVGVATIDRAAGGLTGNGYAQRDSARVLRKGPVIVLAAANVKAGDPVAVTSAGAYSNVAGTGGTVIPNARWEDDTSAGAVGGIWIK